MLILGEKEMNEKVVAVRSRSEGDLGSQNLDNLIMELIEEVKSKRIK